MSKVNPLFLDSTKPIGDKVVTKVELKKVLLHDAETLSLEVMDHYGVTQRFSMTSVEEESEAPVFKCEAWLKYQFQVHYRFVISCVGADIFSSEPKATSAGHFISEDWEPCFDEERIKNLWKPDGMSKDEFLEKVRTSQTPKTNALPQLGPVFYDKMKSLLDDLM